MKTKCAFCGVVIEAEEDIVYGLYPGPALGEDERFFDCRFCRDQWLAINRKN